VAAVKHSNRSLNIVEKGNNDASLESRVAGAKGARATRPRIGCTTLQILRAGSAGEIARHFGGDSTSTVRLVGSAAWLHSMSPVCRVMARARHRAG
jgi:hypothetical protein